MFGTDGSNVGVMMLYGQRWNVVLLRIGLGELCAVKIRVQIMRNDFRRQRIILTQLLNGFVHSVPGVCSSQIADERRDIRLVSLGQAERVF